MPRRIPEPVGDRDALLRSGPFHLALLACIRESGLSLDRIRARLAQHGPTVALSTLSDWQRGHRRPGGERSLEVIAALEHVLGVPERALAELLRPGPEPDRRPGTPGEPPGPLPGPREQDLTVLSRHQTVTIDAAGRRTSVWTRTLIRARRRGVDRYVDRYVDRSPAAPDADPRTCEILALENCRLGEVRRQGPAPAAELLFDQVLRRGESWAFAWEARDRPPAPCTGHEYGVHRPVGQLLVEVRFDPLAPPEQCHSYTRRLPGGEPCHAGALVPNAHGTVHLTAVDLSSGAVGISWRWPSR
ncbi:helix-turn-helix transcriptional regulator [Planomonospora sp. ID91781]|uniref:helix-turn-helix domain-containing protein n=1 Tax=Planomonospora sp. ID91781 TaxID=2738135 RepID=UPI0018C44677|nr:helix-turn-helix transcriptional regulator [Planomonospora sp. ID91781]MBG0822548.1 helix-turn-helix transcriptional regulator [Planomonospora sp. ID91781]